MNIIPALLFAIVIATLDGSTSSLVANFIILGIGLLYTFRVDNKW